MVRLIFASLVTLGLLLGFVGGLVVAAMVYLDTLDLGLALAVTFIFNALIWLTAPFFTDWMLRWVNKTRFVGAEEFTRDHPSVAALIEKVCQQYQFKFPKIGLIADQNPTAFCYGTLRFNARIILTEGMFTYLSEDEVRAVVAHELGHIVNRDFVVMMVASTLIQMLYQIYSFFFKMLKKSSGSSKKGNGNAPILALAITAFVLYQIGIYLLLYLSRTREYLADAFAAKHTSAQLLANALIKIAYGILKVEDTEATQQLLHSTRHLGFIDVKNARYLGLLSQIGKQSPDALADMMLFDIHNVWAKWGEFNSTHPLTGKRLNNLAKLAKELGQPFPGINLEAAARRHDITFSRMLGLFLYEAMVLNMPLLLGGVVGALLYLPNMGVGLPWTQAGAAALMTAMLSYLATYPWRYPSVVTKPTTVIALMSDPFASPARGVPVMLKGEAIGRGQAGSIFSEDVLFKDKTGLVFIDYESVFGWVGNLYGAFKKIPQLIGKPAQAQGWFRRSMGGYIILRQLEPADTELTALRAHPFLNECLGVLVFSALLLTLLYLH